MPEKMPEKAPEKVYVYAFCRAADALPPLPEGIAQPLQWVEAADLVAITEPSLDLNALQQDEARLVSAVVHHDWVLCELSRSVTLLPLRFGTQFETVAQVRSHLQRQADAYQAKLSALQDRAEYCLKFSPQPITLASPAAELQGRAYFLAKKQRLEQQSATEAQQQAQLAQLQAEIARCYPRAQVAADRIYLLVHHDELDQLQHRYQQWQRHCSDWLLQLSEALPPYHFVEV
ncbi:MAG: GvpL/GvpF family gas vesicle protein [Cyanobacteria bacterium J06628_6]